MLNTIFSKLRKAVTLTDSPRFLRNAGCRLDLDEIPSYSRRHFQRLSTLLLAGIVLLAGWICAHQVLAPDIGRRSFVWLGLCVIPHSLVGWFCLSRLKPSWREYAAMYVVGVAYLPLQFLFSISSSAAAPYLLAGTCYLFLSLSNLMMRFRFANASVLSAYTTVVAVWLFARQGNPQALVLCFNGCALLAALFTLYINFVIGNDEMHYMRLEQHFRMVLAGDRRDLWEFDSAARVFRIRAWNAVPSVAPVSHRYEDYLAMIAPEHQQEFIRVIGDSVTRRAVRFHLEFKMRLEGRSEWRWMQLAGYAGGGEGVPTQLIGTCCDVTERKSLHDRVEQQSRECEQAAQEKAEFLATISHSIRTPLNAVIGATAVLATDDLSGEPREMVETIHRSGHLLLTVLNDALDLSPSRLASPQLENAAFSPREALRHCCELINPLARQKNLEVRLHIAPDIASLVRGDEARLQQVLINLLSNAVKFSVSGWVGLFATAAQPGGPAAQTITFCVCDTGVGIGENAQQALFGRFEQSHQQTIAGPAGSGLGLAISQRLVQAMGGMIRCESKIGSGSTFSFMLRFPVAQAAAAISANALAAPLTAPGTEPCRTRVLVAEDNPINQNVLTRMLERLHCAVELADNGAEAVEACQHSSFDVIFMDCDMPVLNGLEATRRIRQLPGFAGVPIIAATADALPANLEACREVGMCDVLIKPLTLARLKTALAQWAGGREPAGLGRS
jgi:signal transduction histidine kinase/CheY-like chemotaxis protein